MSITAQIMTPAKWSCSISKKQPKQGEIIDLIFTVKLENNWHLYSNIQNYEIGPLPATFEFDLNKSYKLIGNVIPVNTKKVYDEVFEVDVNYFEHTAEFRQKIKIIKKSAIIEGTYNYQVCSTKDGKCILGDDGFEFKIN
ncbi:hypothetical protein BTO18_07195 [Polaribacter porphyrae]|uniref:Thiol:disulfide interchange protein DsbD N-terminal domain-containing protein n=1 Tax=Polaribacter porphyrae TaxID=1137780 RepID=A0A2S7WMY3_9FLAO|nr:hypothetical protein BTO18_07195 [Polaribacter porphyrae]